MTCFLESNDKFDYIIYIKVFNKIIANIYIVYILVKVFIVLN